MKILIIILIIVSGWTNAGTYLLGFSIQNVIGIGSEWQDNKMIGCKVFEGVSRDCSEDEFNLMVSLSKFKI